MKNKNMSKKTTYIIIGVIALIVIVGLIWVYGGHKGSRHPAVETPAGVTLMYGFTPNVGYAPFYVAAANGYYSEEGLNVSFQYSSEGDIGATKQVAAGKAEFAYGGDNAIITARAQDIPMVAIQRIIQKNLFGIYSKEESDIKKPKDLVGKKVALTSPAATISTITKIILAKSGLNFDQIQPLYVGGAIISTHLAGKADAFGGYLPQKVVAEAISGKKMNEIRASDFTTIGRTYLYTSDKMVSEHPEIVKKFVRATQKGLKYAVEHPEEAVDAFIQYNADAAEKKALHLAIWKTMAEKGFDKDANGKPIFHLPSEDKWTEKQDQMYDFGAIEKKTDVSKFYTDEFVRELTK